MSRRRRHRTVFGQPRFWGTCLVVWLLLLVFLKAGGRG